MHEETLRLLLAAAPQLETGTLARHLQTAIQNSRRSRKCALLARRPAALCCLLLHPRAVRSARRRATRIQWQRQHEGLEFLQAVQAEANRWSLPGGRGRRLEWGVHQRWGRRIQQRRCRAWLPVTCSVAAQFCRYVVDHALFC